jgi:hypothetical protein
LRTDFGSRPAFFPLPTSAVVNAISRQRCVNFVDGSRLRFDQNGDLRQVAPFPRGLRTIVSVEGPVAPPTDAVLADSLEISL